MRVRTHKRNFLNSMYIKITVIFRNETLFLNYLFLFIYCTRIFISILNKIIAREWDNHFTVKILGVPLTTVSLITPFKTTKKDKI